VRVIVVTVVVKTANLVLVTVGVGAVIVTIEAVLTPLMTVKVVVLDTVAKSWVVMTRVEAGAVDVAVVVM